MVCFKCKECGNNAQGSGPENKWRCSKCNNKVLLQKLLELHEKGLADDTDLAGQNKSLLKTIKRMQGMESGSDLEVSDEEEKGSDSSPEWLPGTDQKKSAKSLVKRKLFQVSDIPPTKKTKKAQATEDENKQQRPTKKNKKSELIATESKDKHEYSICLSKIYKGDSFYYPEVPFDNGLDKFESNELEKEALRSAITKQKNKIIAKLTDLFGDICNVKMTFTKKGQQRILIRCPVLNCNVQEHELKRHLIRNKHKWSEEEANSHVSFCTRYFKYVTKFVKDGVMIPKFCTECNSFFGRMDHHLSINHKLDKSDDKYATLLNHSRDETERFLNAPLDSNRFNYKTTKDFKFKKGNAFLQ